MKYLALILVLAVLVCATLLGCRKEVTGEDKAPSPATSKAEAATGKCGKMEKAFGMKGGTGQAKQSPAAKCGAGQ